MSVEFNNQDEGRVSRVLASLPHVEPPGDFDVRVRSRIAIGKPADRRSWFWPVLAGATPLVLLLAIGSYFVFRPDVPSTSNVASQQNVEQSRPPAVLVNEYPEIVASSPSQSSNSEKMIVKAPDVDNGMVVPSSPSRGPNVGGSNEEAITPRRTINPSGIGNDTRPVPKPRDFDTAISIPIKDVLTQIGVDSQGATNGMKIVSVTPDGAANRLGLRADDVIESIDGKPVNEKTSYKGKFAGKKMKVVRDGQTVEIDLNKP
ncbi:MAG TPA: PDZ domain-containing protein [Pyrinomonadaceae bacterium]|nr:PDZ domain-containing protein [Pyrinomonadaceae bacterium]